MAKFQRILLIEDDRLISELYLRALRNNGYTVDEAITGPDGLKKATTGQYDLVLLDIMIPDMTGIEVLQKLRSGAANGLPQTKIIVTTNLDQDEKSRASVESMADGYLIKADVTPRKLVELISQVE